VFGKKDEKDGRGGTPRSTKTKKQQGGGSTPIKRGTSKKSKEETKRKGIGEEGEANQGRGKGPGKKDGKKAEGHLTRKVLSKKKSKPNVEKGVRKWATARGNKKGVLNGGRAGRGQRSKLNIRRETEVTLKKEGGGKTS